MTKLYIHHILSNPVKAQVTFIILIYLFLGVLNPINLASCAMDDPDIREKVTNPETTNEQRLVAVGLFTLSVVLWFVTAKYNLSGGVSLISTPSIQNIDVSAAENAQSNPAEILQLETQVKELNDQVNFRNERINELTEKYRVKFEENQKLHEANTTLKQSLAGMGKSMLSNATITENLEKSQAQIRYLQQQIDTANARLEDNNRVNAAFVEELKHQTEHLKTYLHAFLTEIYKSNPEELNQICEVTLEVPQMFNPEFVEMLTFGEFLEIMLSFRRS